MTEPSTATFADLKRSAAVGKREVRLSVVKDPLVGAPREFVVYQDGTQVEVPAKKLTDMLAAEERFGRPLSEIKGFSSTSTYVAYLALQRHEDEDCRPEGKYEEWVETIADYELAIAIPDSLEALTGEGDDADPLAQALSGNGRKAGSDDLAV